MVLTDPHLLMWPESNVPVLNDIISSTRSANITVGANAPRA